MIINKLKSHKTVVNRIIMFLLAVVVILACFISYIPVEAAVGSYENSDAVNEQLDALDDRIKANEFITSDFTDYDATKYITDKTLEEGTEAKPDDVDISYGSDMSNGSLSEEKQEEISDYAEDYYEWADTYENERQQESDTLYQDVKSYHYYSTVQYDTTQFKSLAGKLADASSENDLKKIMGKRTDDNVKSIDFYDLVKYQEESSDNPEVATNLIDIFLNQALRLKASLGNKQDADWILGDLQNSWSNGNLQALVNNFECWFPNFIDAVCYSTDSLIRSAVDDHPVSDIDGRNIWAFIDKDTLFGMSDILTMIDLIKGNFTSFDASSYYGVLNSGEKSRFQFRSGVTLGDVFDDADDAFKALLVGAVAGGYASALQSITNVTSSTEELLTQGLDPQVGVYWDGTINNNNEPVYNYEGKGEFQYWEEPSFDTDPAKAAESTIYNATKDICKKVMVPVAAVILAFVFAYEIYEMVCERNNMNEIGGGTFVQLILKLVIAIILVAYAWEIIELIFDMGSMIVSMAVPIAENDKMGENTMLSEIEKYITNNPGTNLDSTETGIKWIIAVEICLNGNVDFGNTLVLFIQSVIIQVGTWVLSLIIYIIVYVRLIEIFIDCCVAPIPLATFTNRSWSQTGMNFLRSVFALALQAFIIFLCLAVFNILVSRSLDSILYNADINGTMWTVIGYSLILIFCLFKSGGLSKSIMAAH